MDNIPKIKILHQIGFLPLFTLYESCMSACWIEPDATLAAIDYIRDYICKTKIRLRMCTVSQMAQKYRIVSVS